MIVPVAGGCGPYAWRGPWGHCRDTPYYGRLPNGSYKPAGIGQRVPSRLLARSVRSLPQHAVPWPASEWQLDLSLLKLAVCRIEFRRTAGATI